MGFALPIGKPIGGKEMPQVQIEIENSTLSKPEMNVEKEKLYEELSGEYLYLDDLFKLKKNQTINGLSSEQPGSFIAHFLQSGCKWGLGEPKDLPTDFYKRFAKLVGFDWRMRVSVYSGNESLYCRVTPKKDGKGLYWKNIKNF
jgi:hypothetical protein